MLDSPKIYTKFGDGGATMLSSGEKVSKSSLQVEAYGCVDELNSHIGLLRAYVHDLKGLDEQLSRIQHALFNVGATLAVPNKKDVGKGFKLVAEEDILWLESCIDSWSETCAPLKHFILPGGCKENALSHVCRSVCRRAERAVIRAELTNEPIGLVVKYLNRLSDYFFMTARAITSIRGCDEIKWDPEG